jgi:hypothetical protein
VSSIELIVPKRIAERLEEEARKAGLSAEELAIAILAERLGVGLDPAEAAEVYAGLAERYMREAERLLAAGDFAQASEKLWGAAALTVKAVAAARGLLLRSHGELFKFVRDLSCETGDPELRRLFSAAGVLHQNFYENWLYPDVVRDYAEDVRQLVQRLAALLERRGS